MQQAGDRIDLAAGQDHSGNRRMTQAVPGMQERTCLDLLAQVRAGVRDDPVFIVARDGDRALCSRARCRIAGTGATAGGIVGVPLRKSATGRGAKNDDTQQTLLPLSFRTGYCADAGSGHYDVITRGRTEDNSRYKRDRPNGRPCRMMYSGMIQKATVGRMPDPDLRELL